MRKSLLIGLCWVSGAFAAEWPQFCGPDRNNVSTETGLADSWPKSGPKVLWETEVHKGYSGPAIRDGKIYVIDREGDKSLLRCLDLDSGKELWRVSFSDPGESKGKKFDGTRGTPTVTAHAIYLVTGYGTFVCIDPEAKAVKWQHNLLEEYGMELAHFGIGQSPSIYGKMVLIGIYSAQVGVAAYDKETGERRWVSPGLGNHSYVSPRVVQLCGREMVVAAGSAVKPPKSKRKKKEGATPEPKKKGSPSHVVGLSPKDGSILWNYAGWNCQIAIPHPVVISDDRLFVTGGYKAGSAMIRIVKTEDGFGVEELYKTDEVGSQIQQPIQVGDYLFIGSNANSRKDGLAGFSLDGKLEWRTKDIDGAPNFERGPFILADGKLIILDGKTGVLHLVKADPKKFTELASAKMVEKNDMAWAPLALSDGKLLVRDWNTLKCVDLK